MGACNSEKRQRGEVKGAEGDTTKVPAQRDPNAPSFFIAQYRVYKPEDYITVSKKTWPAENRLLILSNENGSSLNDPNGINANTCKMFINDEEVEFTNELPGEGQFNVKIEVKPGIKISNLSKLFYQISSLVYIDFTNFDAINVSNMEAMFMYCINLMSADFSGTKGFNTSKVQTMNSLLCFCINLQQAKFDCFSTTKCYDFCQMFLLCQSLTALDLSSFNLAPAGKAVGIKVNNMFDGCEQLTKIGADGKERTCAAEEWDDVFKGCSALPKNIQKSFIPPVPIKAEVKANVKQ